LESALELVTGRSAALTHSLHDFAALRAIHNITIVAPADNFETREAIQAALRFDKPIYFRFGKKVMPHLPRVDSSFELGRASLIREGDALSFWLVVRRLRQH
jgi:transketolase